MAVKVRKKNDLAGKLEFPAGPRAAVPARVSYLPPGVGVMEVPLEEGFALSAATEDYGFSGTGIGAEGYGSVPGGSGMEGYGSISF